ncbi:hypothetical protein OSG_eHP25_00135 [environmental Halophage eHP-25]|nr:hypothetical protein OSG_eHP25_00135 [environmental Halophage eHP-25]
MQEHHRRFFDSIEWNGWYGNDKPHVDCEDKSLDEALSELQVRTQERLSKYKESQKYTSPSEERKLKRQRREHMLDQLNDKLKISGS